LLDVVFGDDLPFVAGDEVVLLVNSLGSTTMMELLIVLKEARAILDARGLKVHKTLVGPYVTCQEMAGISLSLLKLDDELKRFWDMPCASVCYSQM
jgi:dihydroxyacetone kinase-like protein